MEMRFKLPMAVNMNTAVCSIGIPCGLHETCQQCSGVCCLSLRYTMNIFYLPRHKQVEWEGADRFHLVQGRDKC
jgi:hypothetical protein